MLHQAISLLALAVLQAPLPSPTDQESEAIKRNNVPAKIVLLKTGVT